MARNPSRAVTLVYREIHDGSYVIIEKSRDESVARTRRALSSAKTWGEFRRMMHPREYSKVIRSTFDEACEPRPRSTDPFEPSQVSGFDQGDYPPWLQAEMDRWMPPDILERHFERFSSSLNGNAFRLDVSNLSAVLNALRQRGFVVAPADIQPSDSLSSEEPEPGEVKCPYCGMAVECEHLLLDCDITFREFYGPLAEQVEDRWAEITAQHEDDEEFREPEALEELLSVLTAGADAVQEFDSETAPGLSGSDRIYWCESADRVKAAVASAEKDR